MLVSLLDYSDEHTLMLQFGPVLLEWIRQAFPLKAISSMSSITRIDWSNLGSNGFFEIDG